MRTIPDHHFNPVLAQTYGVDAAVFLHNIYFWLKHNKAYEKNFYEGRYWTFNSLAAFCDGGSSMGAPHRDRKSVV